MVSAMLKQSIISHLLITATILTSGIIVNLVQVLLHILVKPFSKRLFHQCMYYVSWTWLAQCVFIADCWSNTELILYCSKEDLPHIGREHNFALVNHSYEIDWLVGWLAIEKFHGLGCTRGFIKNPIKYIPICGWFFGFAEHVFLQRSFDKDKRVIEERIADYMTYPNATWIVVTAEGTRFTKEKHETSIKFAREKNIEPLKHHLIPRARGFATCVPLLKKYNCPMIYNVQLAFDKDAPVAPTLGNLLLGKKVTAHLYIERIPIERAEPTFEFLYDVYREKDALQDSFHKYGNFNEGRGLKPVEGVRMKPRLRILINTVIWIVFSVCLMTYYTIKMILAERYFLLTTVSVSVIAMLYYMLQNILRQSRVRQSTSQYGKSR